jgi:Domain of unknown function (DUF4132)
MPTKQATSKAKDGYSVACGSQDAHEQELLTRFLADPIGSTLAKDSGKMTKEAQIQLLSAALKRIQFQKERKKIEPPLVELIKKMASRTLPFTEEDVGRLLSDAATIIQPADPNNVQMEELNLPIPGVVPALVDWLEARAKQDVLSRELIDGLRRIYTFLKPLEFWAGFKKTVQRMEALLEQKPAGLPDDGEAWAEAIRSDIANMSPKLRKSWLALLDNAPKGSSAKPTAVWRKKADALLGEIGPDEFAARLEQWFGLVGVAAKERIQARNASMLRGLVWYASLLATEPACRALANVVEGGLRKLPQGGLYASSIAKAGITALEEMSGTAPVAQLLRLKHRVKSPWGQEEIQRAFAVAIARSGVSASELEETTTPTFDLDATGKLRKSIGPFTAVLEVTGTHEVSISWLDEKSKILENAGKSLKAHSNEVKGVKRLGSDMEKMLVAQRDRIERLYHSGRTWALGAWRERYLDHPLLGQQCRRLIWQFTEGKQSAAGAWDGDKIVDAEGRKLQWLKPSTQVQLWHPLGVKPETVLAWRRWLEANQITQPFKQAHREVYILTDAELTTRIYSNRFAGHILRQHQLKALCDARGWKFEFLGTWDGGDGGATLELPNWNLRAHFWVEPGGEEHSAPGVLLHVATDQVRFSDPDRESRELSTIPALAFSEVMRDVDLFVGVSSIGADPAWRDGGQGRHREYWEAFSFGDLGATAETRREVLTQLLPKLKIARQCSIEGKFLRVTGHLRTYKIHLGSGNILMEPNDHYLCIVPDRAATEAKRENKLFLPFEGDHTLAVILSKAFLLVEDDKIKDPTIVRQIQGE